MKDCIEACAMGFRLSPTREKYGWIMSFARSDEERDEIKAVLAEADFKDT